MTDEPLFIKHERYRRIERMYRSGLSIVEISKRERLPRFVIEQVVIQLEQALIDARR